MLAALSHDLRSPLTAMRLRLELLDESEDGARLKALVDEMQEMVETTMEFARGVARSEPAVEIDLARLLSDLVEDAGAGERKSRHREDRARPRDGPPRPRSNAPCAT